MRRMTVETRYIGIDDKDMSSPSHSDLRDLRRFRSLDRWLVIDTLRRCIGALRRLGAPGVITKYHSGKPADALPAQGAHPGAACWLQ